jgi:cytochrome c biogenesis factor
VYIGSLVLWAAVSLAWMCLTARHKEQQDSLSDALTSLPVLRVGLSVTFVYFWCAPSLPRLSVCLARMLV